MFILAAAAMLAVESVALPPSHSVARLYPRTKHTLPLYRTGSEYFGNFEANITLGSQNVTAIIDTGSSNSWFMAQGVLCFNSSTLETIPDNLCGFNGPRIKPSTSFHEIPNHHTNMSFGSGERIIASVGFENISFGGFEVPKQEIALAKLASPGYDGSASGLLGLAYPAMTNIYPGDDPSTDVSCPIATGANMTGCNQKHYSPLLTTIFANSQLPSVFSLALGRGAPHAGVMAIGGVPDIHDPRVNITKASVQATVPIEKYDGTKDYTYYLTSVDAFHYAGAPIGAGKGQYIVDSGTVPVSIDKENAKRFSALYDPPGWYNETLALFLVQCNATAPKLSVEIAGRSFPFNPMELILEGEDPDICAAGIQAGVSAPGFPPILGSVWLRSVLAVFDVGKTEMTFASRTHYQV